MGNKRGTNWKYLDTLVQEILESQISERWRDFGEHMTYVCPFCTLLPAVVIVRGGYSLHRSAV